MPNKSQRTRKSQQNKSRPQKAITGSGTYSLKAVQQVADRAARAALKTGARSLAGAAGVPSLAGLAESGAITLYNKAAKFIKGSGSYTNADAMVQNVLFSGKFNQMSKFAGDMNHMAIVGEETLCTVTTGSVAGAEVVLSWPLNLGDSAFLPKCANTCSGFTRWNPQGMYFKFIPSMSQDTANGNYAFKAIYNAGATPITTFLECTDDSDSVTAQLGQAAMCGVECDSNTLGHEWYLLRDGTLYDANGQQIPLTDCDMGTMYFALKPAASVGANTQVGYIKVGYVAIVDSPKMIRSRFGHLHWNNNTGVADATPNGTCETVTTGVVRRHIGCGSGVTVKNSSIEFTKANLNDYYRVRWAWTGGNGVQTTPTASYVGCTPLTYFGYRTNASQNAPQTGVSCQVMTFDLFVQITAAEPTVPSITITSIALPNGTTKVQLEVICLGNGLPATAW